MEEERPGEGLLQPGDLIPSVDPAAPSGLEPLGLLALRMGLVNREQLTRGLEEQRKRTGEGRPQKLGEILTELGLLRPVDVQTLLRMQATEGTPVEASPRATEECLGRYRIVRLLGTGGTSRVFLAEDEVLRRPVALKVLQSTDPETVARFQREARLSATLDHPGIVKVFDSGEVGGRAFLTMQFVDGISIQDRNLPLFDLVSAVRRVADALHYAHSRGILHRDVKPGNILMDRSGAPFLADFGLGRELQGATLSLTGTVMGTPAFMSPEQAKGDFRTLDERSDIYSLGATMYALVTGHAPFEGKTPYDVLEQVCAGSIRPPSRRKPGLPREIDIIIQKAMMLDREARYGSAKEFSEDLGRFLEGEAILAHPPTMTYRMLKAARRRPWMVAISGALVLAVGLSGGILVPGWIGQRRRAEDAEREAGTERATSLVLLQKAASESVEAILAARRRGEAVQAVREGLEGTLRSAYEEAVRRAPERAEPEYWMGRFERAVMREAEAERFQERALEKDPSYVLSLYEAVVLLSGRYAREYSAAYREYLASVSPREPSDPERRRQEVERAFPSLISLRRRIEELSGRLEARLQAAPDAVGLTGKLHAAQGMVLRVAGREAEAREEFVRAVESDPFLEEAFEALAELERDERWYTEGLLHDAGYLGYWLGRGALRQDLAGELEKSGKDPQGAYAGAEADLTRALELDPTRSAAFRIRGSIRNHRGAWRFSHGGETGDDLRLSEEDFNRALELDPEDGLTWLRRALLRLSQGEFLSKRGGDPEEIYRQAEQDAERAISLLPEYGSSWLARGRGRALRAWARKARGEDGSALFAEAEKDLRQAVERNPLYVQGFRELAGLRIHQGLGTADPSEEYRCAEEDLRRALALDPEDFHAWKLLGDVRRYQAFGPAGTEEEFRDSREAYTNALKFNPASGDAWTARGMLYLRRAEKTKEGEILEQYELAEKDFQQALEVSPTHSGARLGRAVVRNARGNELRKRKLDPSEFYRGSADDFSAVLEQNPKTLTAWKGRGLARFNLGVCRIARGEDPGPDFLAGEADFSEAIDRSPADAEAWMRRGDLRYRRGRYCDATGKPEEGTQDFVDAVQDYEEALRLNPSLRDLFGAKLEEARRRTE